MSCPPPRVGPFFLEIPIGKAAHPSTSRTVSPLRSPFICLSLSTSGPLNTLLNSTSENQRHFSPSNLSPSFKHKHRELLESLHKVGFRTNLGIKDSGFGLLAWSKLGGYYFGMSDHISVRYFVHNFFKRYRR